MIDDCLAPSSILPKGLKVRAYNFNTDYTFLLFSMYGDASAPVKACVLFTALVKHTKSTRTWTCHFK